MTAMGVPQRTFDYTGKTIVDCPSCKTRFCVKNEVLERHSEPNFHCSRCDHVFRINLSELRAKNAAEELAGKVQATATSSNISSDSRQTPSRNFNISHEPRTNSSVSAPHEHIQNDDAYSRRSAIENSLTGSAHLNREAKPRREVRAIDLLRHVNIFSKKERPAVSPAAMAASSPLHEGRWQDLVSIATPILIFLLSLSFVSFYLTKNPGAAGSIISAIVPSAPRVTPVGLHVTKTEFSKVTLDSGEEIALVSGEIQNTTDITYGSVNLEAQAFDKEGNLVKKSMTASGSALVNTRVKSLSPKLIDDIQTTKGPRRLAIGPNRVEKFAVALMGDEIKNAAYFSIRIYSVRAQS